MKTLTIAALVAVPLAVAVAAPAQASIQSAIDAASPGDTIVVRGTHRENLVIGKDGITLRGVGAVLLAPAEPAANACFDPSVEGEAVHGICVSGDIDFETGQIARYVKGVSVSNFTVRGFTGNGITAAGARDATFSANVVEGNGDGGIAAIGSTSVRVLGNRTSGNRFGVYVGGSVGGAIAGNAIRGNCVGVLALGQPGPAGGFRVTGNEIAGNTRACPAGGDWPALSGVGVALVGASGNTVAANAITGNVPSADSALAGGVAVLAEPGGTPAERNVVAGNVIRGNDPDVFWDRLGAGNVFRGNVRGE
jgi:parallel beta-helix repeat protein